MRVNKKNVPDCTTCKVRLCVVASSCSEKWKDRANLIKKVVSYNKGQLIVKEGTETYGIYVNYKGKVIITSEREDQKRQIIRIAREGDILEFIQYDDYYIYPFSIEAFEPCICCYLSISFLSQFFNENIDVLNHFEQRYASKLIDIERWLKYALIMKVKAKLIYVLLHIADVCEGKIPMLRRELGEMIGASAEQVTRELMCLASENLIDIRGRNKEIYLLDKEGLINEIAQYEPSIK